MKLKNRIKKSVRSLVNRERDPRYIFVLFGGVFIFIISCLQAFSAGLFDSIERPIFEFFNNLPDALYGFMYAVTQFGGLSSLILWIGLAWYLISRRAALNVAATGVVGWFMARVVKTLVQRGRPGDVLENINLFQGETLGGYGFPSGHATFSAACATVLYFQIAPKYRKYLVLLVVLVGISRMYIGAHFPLDIIGGWALGALIGALSALIFGVYTKGLSLPRLKKYLATKGYNLKSIKFADVDARGSKPLFMEAGAGEHYFGKVFGKQEHAADWLFKIFRLFRYKNLQAEEPHVYSRRNVEMEAFAMLWAKQGGVRVTKVIDLLRYGSSWLLIQQKIDAKPLSDHGHLLQKSLVDAWQQVEMLHAANIAHRDLRAANLLIDKQGKVWIIDFGFAEVSSNNQRKYMDIAELLMSMALVVGTERTIDAAFIVIDPAKLTRTLPYLQKAVFSGATTKQLKQNKEILGELKESIKERLAIEEDIEEINILRVNARKVINLVLLALFIYFVAPQFGSFKNAFEAVDIKSAFWLIPLAVFSMLTYVFTGMIYAALASVPIRIRESALVQLASSFVSKILPGGLGGTGLNTKFLTRSGMDITESSAVIASQGVIGFVMFTVPLTVFLLLNGKGVSDLIQVKLNIRYFVYAGIALFIIAVTLAIFRKIRSFVVEKSTLFIEGLRNISTPSRELTFASISSLAVTLSYIACLYASFRAFDLPLGLSAAVLVYATAVIAKSAIPTPGGLGPLEAAMIGALVALGASKDEAFSTVLLYRLATFWLPIPFSLLAYKYISNKRII